MSIDHHILFSRNLRLLREQLHLTQAELALQIGSPQQGIARLESGRPKPNPSMDMLIRLATALGCTLDQLVGREKIPKKKSPEHLTLHPI